MMEAPTPKEIGYFLDKVDRVDRRAAEAHFIRTGEPMRDAPDKTVIKVLDWLKALRGTDT